MSEDHCLTFSTIGPLPGVWSRDADGKLGFHLPVETISFVDLTQAIAAAGEAATYFSNHVGGRVVTAGITRPLAIFIPIKGQPDTFRSDALDTWLKLKRRP